MKVIPAIDIIGGKTVRLVQGDYDRNLNYDVDPVEAAKEWEKAGAELIHVVDLEGARHGKPENLAVIQKIASAVKIPVEVGGGFREYRDIENALKKGIWRVVIGSRAIEEKEFAEKCLAKFGEKVILSVDAKGLSPRTRGWEKVTTADIFEVMDRFVSYGAKELIYTEITRDGMLGGPAIENLENVLDRVKVKIIAAGGIGDIEHIRQLKKLETRGVSGVILGRALYEGAVDLREAIRVGKENNTVS